MAEESSVIALAKRIIKEWEDKLPEIADQQILSVYWHLKGAIDDNNVEGVRVMLPSVIKFLVDFGIIKRSLAAGNYNQAPSQLTGGTALMVESRGKKKKKKVSTTEKADKVKVIHTSDERKLNKGSAYEWFNGEDLDAY